MLKLKVSNVKRYPALKRSKYPTYLYCNKSVFYNPDITGVVFCTIHPDERSWGTWINKKDLSLT